MTKTPTRTDRRRSSASATAAASGGGNHGQDGATAAVAAPPSLDEGGGGMDDLGSIASQGSRTSVRLLKRRREEEQQLQHHQMIQATFGLDEMDEEEMEGNQLKATKRQRLRSTQKPPRPPSQFNKAAVEDFDYYVQLEGKETAAIPTEIETTNHSQGMLKLDNHPIDNINDGAINEKDERGAPAVPTNGHGGILVSGATVLNVVAATMTDDPDSALVSETMNSVKNIDAMSVPRAATIQDVLPKYQPEERREPQQAAVMDAQFEAVDEMESKEQLGLDDVGTQPRQTNVQYIQETIIYWMRNNIVTTYLVKTADIVEHQFLQWRGMTEEQMIIEQVIGGPVYDNEEIKASPLDRTLVWFLMLLLCQVPIFFHMVLPTTVNASKVFLHVYRGPQTTNANDTLSSSVDMSSHLALEKISTLVKLQTELANALDTRDMALRKLHDGAAQLQTSVTDKLQNCNTLERDAIVLKTSLNELFKISDDTWTKSQPYLTVSSLMKKNSAIATIPLVDISRVQLWNVRDEASDLCHQTEDKLDFDKFERALLMVRSDIDDAVISIQKQPEMLQTVREWIRETLHNEMGITISDSTFNNDEMNEAGIVGNSHINEIITKHLEVWSADQTGIFDYASIMNGAQVINAKTSPSLVDRLPIVNRVAAFLGLRFYGYGPEVALLPTYPPHALGQCFSFEADAQASASLFGVLTIRFAKPIYVQSILIEHPIKNITHGVDTAIRSFHVQGFEDRDAMGDAWKLGSFEYNIEARGNGRQEFIVSTTTKASDDIPLLRSMRLEIESNWGGSYVCLYRVRVHGKEKRPDNSIEQEKESVDVKNRIDNFQDQEEIDDSDEEDYDEEGEYDDDAEDDYEESQDGYEDYE